MKARINSNEYEVNSHYIDTMNQKLILNIVFDGSFTIENLYKDLETTKDVTIFNTNDNSEEEILATYVGYNKLQSLELQTEAMMASGTAQKNLYIVLERVDLQKVVDTNSQAITDLKNTVASLQQKVTSLQQSVTVLNNQVNTTTTVPTEGSDSN